MTVYDMRRSTATPISTLAALRAVDLSLRAADMVLRVAEWHARRRTRKLLGTLDERQLNDIGLRRDDIGRF